MDPITIAMALAQFVPDIIKYITGSNKAASNAQKIVDIAKAVTGKDGLDAVSVLKSNPELLLKFQQAVMLEQLEMSKLEVENMGQVNATMQVEAKAEHWPSYSWRPSIGFSVTYNVVVITTLVFIVFCIAIFKNRPDILQYIPPMLMADAALLATVLPILGIASYFRGKMQADVNIPSDNRG